MNFTVYKSSAGSGKTFTLVKEYLKIALGDEQMPPQKYRNILAITFTNKAAGEMKERVIKSLKTLSSPTAGNDELLLSLLKVELNLPAHEIQLRAANLLTAILHNYSDFAIGTIDSFVHKIIRTFAHDLHLPVNFEIEMDSDKLLLQTIDLLISNIGTDETLTKTLIEFTESKTADEKNWSIEYDLFKFASNLLKEESLAYINQLKSLTLTDFFDIRNRLFEAIKSFEKEVKESALSATLLIKNNGLVATDFYYGDRGIAAYFEKLAQGNMEGIKPNSYVQKTIDEDKWNGSKTTALENAAITTIKAKLISIFNSIQQLYDKRYAEYVLYNQIAKRIYSLAVLNEIEGLLTAYKKANNILHISEFNRIIAEIVLSQPVPFIYERLGEKYQHYLLDEFQDTSVLQWQNLLPLIDNSLAENNFNMIVGDAKQAIYRWRGGEVELFARLPEVLGAGNNELLLERERSLKHHFTEKQLTSNYRSKAEIVQFNNTFFKFMVQALDDEKVRAIYNSVEQHYNPEHTGGAVQLEFLNLQEQSGDMLEEKRTLELIHELQNDNFQLRDIVLLTRSNQEGVAIATYLINNNIPVLSSESLLIKTSDTVNFICNFLYFLNDPYDQISKAAVFNYLSSNGKIKTGSLDTLLMHIKNKSKVTDITALLNLNGYSVNSNYLVKLPVYELCEELVRIFNLAAKTDPYVLFFLDEVQNFTGKNSPGLPEFIDWWQERKEKATVVVPEGINAVTILSIHKSKGLEYPVVILPYANWAMDKGKEELWIKLEPNRLGKLEVALVPAGKALLETEYAALKEEESAKALLDNLNVLYVAMTRAVERLYLLTTLPKQSSSIARYFIDYLKQQNNWDDKTARYHFGNTGMHKNKESKQQTAYLNLTKAYSENWRERLMIRVNSEEVWPSSANEERKNKGIILHTALARIRSIDDIETAGKQLMMEGLIDMDEYQELTKKLTTLLHQHTIKPFFMPGLLVKNESEIILSNGESFRPDRVMIINNNAIIIDYKTGKESAKYTEQVIRYKQILQKMSYTTVTAYLIYTQEEILEEIK